MWSVKLGAGFGVECRIGCVVWDWVESHISRRWRMSCTQIAWGDVYIGYWYPQPPFLSPNSINKVMNIRNNSDSAINQWLAGFQIVKETVSNFHYFSLLLLTQCSLIQS